MNRDRGLPWGRPEKKNDLFASLKGSIFYCPFAFNRRWLTLPGNKKPPPETGDGHFSPVGVRRLELRPLRPERSTLPTALHPEYLNKFRFAKIIKFYS